MLSDNPAGKTTKEFNFHGQRYKVSVNISQCRLTMPESLSIRLQFQESNSNTILYIKYSLLNINDVLCLYNIYAGKNQVFPIFLIFSKL